MIAMGIYDYEKPNDPEALLGELDAGDMTDTDYFRARATDYAVAANVNSGQNDKRAKYLNLSVWSIMAGLILHGTYFYVG